MYEVKANELAWKETFLTHILQQILNLSVLRVLFRLLHHFLLICLFRLCDFALVLDYDRLHIRFYFESRRRLIGLATHAPH